MITESCGFKESEVKMEYTLFNELGINSIDMLDILFTLEMEYNISLKVSDLEQQSRAEMNGVPFEIDNVITDEGLDVLRKKMPELSNKALRKGITVNDIIHLLTVESLANMVLFKIENPE